MKSFKTQFMAVGITALAIAAITAGCSKSQEDSAYQTTTNAMENTKDATTNAAMKTWDATKEGAAMAGDAITNAAEHVKTDVTNAWDKATSTN